MYVQASIILVVMAAVFIAAMKIFSLRAEIAMLLCALAGGLP